MKANQRRQLILETLNQSSQPISATATATATAGPPEGAGVRAPSALHLVSGGLRQIQRGRASYWGRATPGRALPRWVGCHLGRHSRTPDSLHTLPPL